MMTLKLSFPAPDFGDIVVDKSTKLGSGTYGSVYKIKVNINGNDQTVRSAR